MGLSHLLALFCVLFLTSVTGQYIIACTNNVTATTNVPTASSFVTAQASAAQRAAFNAFQNLLNAQLANNAIQAVNPFNPFSAFGPIFNLANPLNILNPLNPFGITTPLNPFGLTSPLNPFSINSPANIFNPLNPGNIFNPLNPVNPANPVNPLNPINPFNPFTPIGQVNNFALFTGALTGALAAVRPLITLPGITGEVGASDLIEFNVLIRDLVALNIPGLVARFNLTGPVDVSTIVVTCSIQSACGTPNITRNSDGTTSIIVPIKNTFPDAPIVVPLSIKLTLRADQSDQIENGRTGTPTDRVKLVHDLFANFAVVLNSRANGETVVRYCENEQDLLDGDCSNRCHNNKRKCSKDPNCRWFGRGDACIKKNSKTQ